MMTNWEGVPAKMIPIDQIMDDPMNPNVMSKDQLKSLEFSMEKEDNVVPIIINKVTEHEKQYMVVNGHQRLKILRKRGITKVLCVVIQRPLDEARAFGLGLNRNIGEDNPEKLSKVLKFVFENKKLNLITKFIPSFDSDFVKVQIDKFHNTGLSTPQDTEIPEIPISTKTKPGDMYMLGKHRIMCGDSTLAKDVNQLIGKVKINQLNTDPPYGVDYHGSKSFLKAINPNTKRAQFKSEGRGEIKNYYEFFKKFLDVIPMAEHNTCYIFMAGLRLHELRMAFEDAGYIWGDYLVWLKNHFVMGRKDHKAKHENILYGWKGKHKFYGEYGTTTVYEERKPQKSENHPTSKPVELIARIVIEGSRKNDYIYEPFSGSGTCIIACENEGRRCIAMEKVPHYIDVAVTRWEQRTGKKAEKISGK